MKKLLILCLVLIGGCALKTIEEPAKEKDVSTVSEQSVTQTIKEKAPKNRISTQKKAKKQTKSAASEKKHRTKLVPATGPLKCENIVGIRLYQIFNTFAMGQTCISDHKNFSCTSGQTVYVPKNEGKSYKYDDIILPQSGECFAYDGTFHYYSKGNIARTAPSVKLIVRPQQVDTPKAAESKGTAEK